MTKLFHTLVFMICGLTLSAQTMPEPQRTLRVDYQFTGDANTREIALSELCSFEGWAGRRVHTDSVPLKGNGDITLTLTRYQCDALLCLLGSGIKTLGNLRRSLRKWMR